jgi:hypothetical protein
MQFARSTDCPDDLLRLGVFTELAVARNLVSTQTELAHPLPLSADDEG